MSNHATSPELIKAQDALFPQLKELEGKRDSGSSEDRPKIQAEIDAVNREIQRLGIRITEMRTAGR